MKPSRITRFRHAFYLVWTIGVMGSTPHLRNQALALLHSSSPRELCRLEELEYWAQNNRIIDFGSSGSNFKEEVWKTGCAMFEEHYILNKKRERRWAGGLARMPVLAL